ILYIFFFSSRRRHTRLQGDWSSDVCSSDLGARGRNEPPGPDAVIARMGENAFRELESAGGDALDAELYVSELIGAWWGHYHGLEIGRASCRERVRILAVGRGKIRKAYAIIW